MSTIAGSYADEKDFITYYSEIEGVDLSNIDDPDAITIDRPRLRQALIAASNYVNSKVAKRYAVPLQDWGEEITRVVCAIAVHNNLDMFEIREATETRYQDAIAWLDEIREGKADLVGADGKVVPETAIAANTFGMGLTIV